MRCTRESHLSGSGCRSIWAALLLFKIPISITKSIKAHALDLSIRPDPQLSFRIEESKSYQYKFPMIGDTGRMYLLL
jgi:hypothetical protein